MLEKRSISGYGFDVAHGKSLSFAAEDAAERLAQNLVVQMVAHGTRNLLAHHRCIERRCLSLPALPAMVAPLVLV